MNNRTLSIALAFLVIVVLSFVVLILARPCDGNYSFELRNGLKFSCTEPPNASTEIKQEAPESAKPPKQTIKPSPKPPISTPSAPPPTAVVSATSSESLVPCTQVRSSLTTRKKVTNIGQADEQCRVAVKGLPKDYQNERARYKLQDDHSVTFNTGQFIEEQELWCNCLPN